MLPASETKPVSFPECDREPIHIPGSIQPHGFLLVIDEQAQVITHASENAATFLYRPLNQLIGASARDVLGEGVLSKLLQAAHDPLFNTKPLLLEADIAAERVAVGDLDLVAHRRNGRIIIEAERVPPGMKTSLRELHSRIELVVSRMERAENPDDQCRLAVEEFRRFTHFDRVMIYRFDEDWHGTVIAEDRNDKLPSYLDLRFPATDIPQPARELYRINRSRLIASSDYTPVKILTNPLAEGGGEPIDLSLSTLRSVSPVHLQYMRNMGTAASMSISIMRGDRLWGLVSCHHAVPHIVPFAIRSAAELLTQIFSLQLAAREKNASFRYRLSLHAALTELVPSMSRPHFVEALAENWERVLSLTSATGMAIITNDACVLRGRTPTKTQAVELAAWLGAREASWDLFQSDRLSTLFNPAYEYKEVASGVLAVSISRVSSSYVIWFRPEIVQTVKWGGDPHKREDEDRSVMNPRKSFDAWKEIVSGRSAPWLPEEIETVSEFKNALLGIVLKRAEEMAALTEELTRANKELAAFSYSVSHDLRAPFRHIRSYAEILQEDKKDQLDPEANGILDRILESSIYAGKLVDNLLAFAQMGRTAIVPQMIFVEAMVTESRKQIGTQKEQQKILWELQPLPNITGDLVLIRQVWQNLIENAVKYSSKRPIPRIKISATETETEVIYSIEDNGVGFDMSYIDKLFGVFQRLHRSDEFEGTGIGLANVRRIVERHGGKAWARGELNVGATFSFSLPKHPLHENAQTDSSR